MGIRDWWGIGAKTLGPNTPGPDMLAGGRDDVFADGHVKFVRADTQVLSTQQQCPDIHRTPGGLSGMDVK